MQNILKDYQTWLILIVALIIFFLLGFELYVFLALAITYFPVQWLSEKYPKLKNYLFLIGYVFILCLDEAHQYWLVNYQATNKSQQVCGILTKNEHHFFPLSPLNPANFIIQTSATEMKEFRTEKFRNDVGFRGLKLNQHICVQFVPTDKNWLLLHDYIVKVEQS
ncbi:hypothetical protein [Moraxella sp. ZY210820]|uniref:hypothetical protein n=1 Tax=unclassified Moraxella TaxID=2685852 RepID=UPI002730D3DE|nr:hypothetical protein [Moraxella sp. ZY210820]WLF85018.1 hypothetical protein LU301_06015 [Moraxella sp. ZY210820]